MKTVRARPSFEIAVIVRAKPWRAALPRAASICRRAAEAALTAAYIRSRERQNAGAELTIVLASDAFVAKLNRDYRGKKGATNVLSFPSGMTEDANGAPLHLGDVVIALETVRREARAQGKPLAHHLSHLVVHGVLHLLGHDHIKERQANRMERIEVEVLSGLKIPDPYRMDERAKVA
jgi:probable rRNA maturation factor